MRPTLLHVITRLCVGGAQLSVHQLCRDLAPHFDIHVACGPDIGQEGSIEAEVARDFPLRVLPHLRRPIRPVDDVRVVGSLRGLYAEIRPDIVHTHSSKAGIVGRLAARGRGPVVVHTVHGWGHTPNDSSLKRAALVAAERRAAHSTDALIAVSADVREEGLRLGIGTASKYRVIPEYVDLRPRRDDFDAQRAEARELLGLAHQVETMGWVGRFMAQKDPATLAAVTADLLQRRPGLHAVFVGDGPHRPDVERALGHFGGRVHFAGVRRDVRRLYAAFDVLLHTSRWEGQPRVVQEAIAERIPVVTARVSGTRELFEGGDVGVEVAAGDVGEFVGGVEAILDDPERSAPLAREAVLRLAVHSGREVALPGHVALYHELLDGRTARTAGSTGGSAPPRPGG